MAFTNDFAASQRASDVAMPSPAVHTRSVVNLNGDDARRAADSGLLISPAQTPQGSPSKTHAPPGSFDLPDVFSSAMKLFPTAGSSNKASRLPVSPSKQNKLDQLYPSDESADSAQRSGSPTRRSNKENTEPRHPLAKDSVNPYISSAAASRQDPYRPSFDSQRPSSPARNTQKSSTALSQEDVEKLAKPSVKRLANVTQLCMHPCHGGHQSSH